MIRSLLTRARKYSPFGELRASIRIRLTAWYVSLLALVLIAFSVGVYIFLIAHISTEVSDVETTYQRLYTHTAAQYPIGTSPVALKTVPRDSGLFGQLGIYSQSILDAGPGGELAVALPDVGPLRARATAVLLGVARPGCSATADNHLACVWFVTGVKGVRLGVVAMQGSLSGVIQSEDELQTALIIGVPLSLLIALVGGWMLASRALSPIEQLRLTAQSITATDLSRRIGLHRDDELGRLARTLDEMIAGLDSAFAEQRRLTADVSHELRTPLAIIQAQASLALKRGRSPEEYAAVIGSIQEETERMSRIVDDLLLLARAEAGQEVLERDPVRLDVVARWATEHLRGMALDGGIDLNVSLRPVMVMGDAGRLRQMVLNLVHNAIKYTQPGGTVRVRVNSKGGVGRLSVADTGAGIDERSLPHIFERFYMVDRSRSEGGTGLGLSIVQWIVEGHGGTIAVQSERTTGSTFVVRIPLHTEDQIPESEDGPPGIPAKRVRRLTPVNRESRVEIDA